MVRVTISWKDSPNQVSSLINFSGWNRDGYWDGTRDKTYETESGLEAADKAQLNQARRAYRKFGPPDHPVTFWTPAVPDLNHFSRTGSGGEGASNEWITFPSLLELFGSLPLLWLLAVVYRNLATRRTVPTGVCRQCGYDLRATPDRCPECGTEV
jgi:hypothetical protein